MPFLLIAPASRGIGFALTRHLLRTTQMPVVATAREDCEGVRERILSGLEGGDSGGGGTGRERLDVLKVDVTDEPSVEAAASFCREKFPSSSSSSPNHHHNPSNHLHAALLLPGILHPEKSPSQITPQTFHSSFTTNTLGPLLLMKHFSPFLPPKRSSPLLESSLPRLDSESSSDYEKRIKKYFGPKISPHVATLLSVSARVGSISDNKLGGWYTYRASKAALNSVTKTFDLYLRQRCGERAFAMTYHPGTVKTGLSKEFWGGVPKEKLFSPERAVEELVKVVGMAGGGEIGVERARGRCWDWRGVEVPP
ncbi:MAG: hypothetical protein M1817_001156 [Caeruleum heppii]|nr:MAG: hypothetical protein M1817_001156 [Caeruleum heppii]